MKANYSKLLTKIAGIVGVSGASLLITLPSTAEQVRNPQSDLRQENLYSHHHGNHNQKQSNTQSTTPSETQVAQSRGDRILNPRPSIFNEPPYNRRRVQPTTPPENTTPDSTEPGMTTPDTGTEPSQATETPNVIKVAEKAGSFKTLLTAVEAAGLKDTLQGEGPFTIFAPTDEAFAKLPQDAVQDLLKPENREVLVKILTYHVVPGKVKSGDLTKMLQTNQDQTASIETVQGEPITLKMTSEGLFANDGQVTKADIPASNGVIHIINNVILPPSL
jgi:uncharacterized surface protein with fasciclin (FAS1) repeats